MSGKKSYDVAIIGAGPEGLAASVALGRAGLKTIVLERDSRAGGRAVTREFHPGFRASPFADELPAILPELFWAADLARHGAIVIPQSVSVCIGDGGKPTTLFADQGRALGFLTTSSADAIAKLNREISGVTDQLVRYGATPPARSLSEEHYQSWPGESWGMASIESILAEHIRDPALRLHLAAEALSGRAASPYLAGSGLHLLSLGAGKGGAVAGGLGALGAALVRAVEAARIAIRVEAEVTEIKLSAHGWGDKRVKGVVLKGGEEITAKAVLSSLDLKQTFLRLIPYSALKDQLQRRVGQFRMNGQCARVLFALAEPPEFHATPELARGVFHVAPSLDALSRSYELWRSGVLNGALQVSLRFPSVADPLLAPVGKATMTATISPIPAELLDGSWTPERRKKLEALAVAAAERVAPGIAARVIASEVLVAHDMAAALGATAGDLDGGEIAPDQVFSHRPFAGWGGRTPIRGLYLGGSSAAPAPFFTGASSWRAAEALLADFKSGRTR